jgi:hypothetical protein
MNVRAATDMIANPLPIELAQMGQRESQDIRGLLSGTRRRFLLLCLLVVVAFVATVVVVYPWKGSNGAVTAANSVGAAQNQAVASRQTSPPAPAVFWNRREELNPAVQQPGPPDPEAQRTAVASAERAARAAADLAAAQ